MPAACLALLLAFAALPTGAQDCAHRADLTGGIRVVEHDGQVAIYTSARAGVVRVEYDLGGGQGERLDFIHGIYNSRFAVIEDGRENLALTQSVRFDFPAGAPPALRERAEWQVGLRIREGTDSWQAVETYSTGRVIRREIGTCSYDVLPVTILYRNEFGSKPEHELILYFTELGIAHTADWGQADRRLRWNWPRSISPLN